MAIRYLSSAAEINSQEDAPSVLLGYRLAPNALRYLDAGKGREKMGNVSKDNALKASTSRMEGEDITNCDFKAG
jgi:hypothetical protein